MAKPARPKPPAALGAAGKRLWRAIHGDLEPSWELDQRERHLLLRACECADNLAELAKVIERDGATVEGSRGQLTVHPALSEARQLRLVQARLLGSIETSDPNARPATDAQSRARKAAEARWSEHRERRAARRG